MDAVIRILVFVVQLTSMFVVAWAVLRLFWSKAKGLFNAELLPGRPGRNAYVAAVPLALEILVAAGVLTTVLHPSWSAIGKLGAIAALRTLIKRSLTFSIRPSDTKAPAL